MLETIREFAVERLESLPDADRMAERHARWYLGLAKGGGRAMPGPAQGDWLLRLEDEVENLRSAIGWARNRDDGLEVELVEATWYFFSRRGLLREALSYVVHALEAARKITAFDQGELLFAAGYVAVRVGDYAAAEEWLTQRLELGRARGDARLIGTSLVGLALSAEQNDDLEKSRTLYLEGADVARSCGDTGTLAVVAGNLGYISLRQGDADTSRMHFQQTLELNRELSDAGGRAVALAGLALVALGEQDTDEAEALLRSSLRLANDVDDREVIFSCLLGSAEVAAQRSEMVRAARLVAAADALCEEMGYAPPPLERAQRARVVAVPDADDAVHVAARSEGRALTVDEAVAYVLEGG